MLLAVCAVKDMALDAFMRPLFVPRMAMAERSFADEVRRQESEMQKHPGDYALYAIAHWDEDTGMFTNIQPPQLIVRALDCVVKGEQRV